MSALRKRRLRCRLGFHFRLHLGSGGCHCLYCDEVRHDVHQCRCRHCGRAIHSRIGDCKCLDCGQAAHDMAVCACPAILIPASFRQDPAGGWFQSPALRIPQDVICAAVPTGYQRPAREGQTPHDPRPGHPTPPSSSFGFWCVSFHERVLNARGRDLQMEIEPHLSRIVGQLLLENRPVRIHCVACGKDYPFMNDYGRAQSSGVGIVEVFHLDCPQGHPLVSVGGVFGPPSPVTDFIQPISRPFAI